MTKKRNRRALQAMLAVVLLIAVAGMGTLAYLTASQSGENALVNTFVAAGGGSLVDPDPDPIPDPGVDPGIEDKIDKGFYLLESPATYANGFYTLDKTAGKVLTNTYDKVMPSMNIPKDPKLTLNLAEGAEAYVFVKVTDTTSGNLTYTVSGNWSEVTGVTLNAGEKLYAYNGGKILTGTEATEINGVSILTGDSTASAGTLNDTDAATDGMQLGQLKFESYLCQAGGFASAAEAFTACF